MKESKYNFIEFIAATECKDFDVLEDYWIKWAKRFVNELPHISEHYGDCQSLSCPCYLCTLERYLKDYHTFVFDEEKFRKEI